MQQILDQTSTCELRQALTQLPESLHDVYDSMLQRVKEQSHNRSSLAIRILTWLSYAVRPLTVVELQHAVAIDINVPSPNPERVPPARFIEDVCMDLVTIDKERNIVLLTHASLKHYLNQLRESLFPGGKRDIAYSCLAYLRYSEFGRGPCETGDAYRQRLDSYPFAVYAAQHWGTHVYQFWSDEVPREVLEVLTDPSRLSSLSQIMYASSGRGMMDF